MAEPCWRVDLGCRSFGEALEIQRRLVTLRQSGRVPDLLVFVEHPPTYTLGRGGRREHLLAANATLSRLGATYVETDRGGDITFHGPGQLVGYPIIDLRSWKRDVHAYLRALEQVLIEALAEFGIDGSREEDLTGVWHDRGKLAAIGVRVAQWITSHGFALNIATELEFFKHIVPCGIVDRSVSSMEDVLRDPVARGPVEDAVSRAFGRVFARDVSVVLPQQLEAMAV